MTGNWFPEALGWLSSMILLVTLMSQVLRQWRSASVEGVSWWLFAGQIGASTGFLTYSVLIENPVFIVTNALILMTSVAGQGIFLYRRKRPRQTQ
jgi:uncharacterized protein with PQ loop repeat